MSNVTHLKPGINLGNVLANIEGRFKTALDEANVDGRMRAALDEANVDGRMKAALDEANVDGRMRAAEREIAKRPGRREDTAVKPPSSLGKVLAQLTKPFLRTGETPTSSGVQDNRPHFRRR